MREYGKVTGGFWTGATGRALRGDAAAQLVALYVLTASHGHMAGVFYCPAETVALETGLDPDAVHGALARLAADGFLAWDPRTEEVWVCGMARVQIAPTLQPGDKRVPHLVGHLLTIRSARLRAGFVTAYVDAFSLRAARNWPALEARLGVAECPTEGPSGSPFEAPKPLPEGACRSQEQLSQGNTTEEEDLGEIQKPLPEGASRRGMPKPLAEAPSGADGDTGARHGVFPRPVPFPWTEPPEAWEMLARSHGCVDPARSFAAFRAHYVAREADRDRGWSARWDQKALGWLLNHATFACPCGAATVRRETRPADRPSASFLGDLAAARTRRPAVGGAR